MRYIFSGNMKACVPDILKRNPDFKPISLLCTYLEKHQFKNHARRKEEGLCDFLMIDSGAYGVHTGKVTATVDDYINFINDNHEICDAFAELDTIPGKLNQPKSPQDYVESAEKSWESFLYIRSKVKCPEKIMPVYHSGENLSYLENMLNWKDSNGVHLDYIGISPANDSSVSVKSSFMQDVIHTIRQSDDPGVKTHLFGLTSLPMLQRFPCYSCDSTTHVRLAGFGCLISPTFGNISVSSKNEYLGSTRGNFLLTASESNLRKLEQELSPLGLTLDDVSTDIAARTAFNMMSVLNMVETDFKYNPSNGVRKKRLV